MRNVLFHAKTPWHAVPMVVCYEDTWLAKLVQRVPDGLPDRVMRALSCPSSIVQGTSNITYVAYVDSTDISPRTGSPFVVIVDPEGRPFPAVVSVGHRYDFKLGKGHQQLWP